MWRPSGVFNRTYAEDRTVIRTRTQWIGLILLLSAVVAIPFFFANPYLLSIIILTIITIISLQGLNFILGFCGQISVGHSAFMAIGAYTTTILMTTLGFPFFLSLPCAGFSAALVGLRVRTTLLEGERVLSGFSDPGRTISHRMVSPPWRAAHGEHLRPSGPSCQHRGPCAQDGPGLLPVCHGHAAPHGLLCQEPGNQQDGSCIHCGEG